MEVKTIYFFIFYMDARMSLHMQTVESDTIYEIQNTAEWSRDIRTLLHRESLESSHASCLNRNSLRHVDRQTVRYVYQFHLLKKGIVPYSAIIVMYLICFYIFRAPKAFFNFVEWQHDSLKSLHPRPDIPFSCFWCIKSTLTTQTKYLTKHELGTGI